MTKYKDKKIINDWFSARDLDLSECQFKYLKEDKEVSLEYDIVLEAVLDRISDVRLIQILDKMEKYYKNDWYDRKNKDTMPALLDEAARFFQDMANYKVFENHRFFTFAQLAQDYDMEEKFLKFWMNEQGLNEQQMLCHHDDSDQFAEDGNWYNSVGTCIRCRVHMNKTIEQSDSVDLVYKAWNRTK